MPYKLPLHALVYSLLSLWHGRFAQFSHCMELSSPGGRQPNCCALLFQRQFFLPPMAWKKEVRILFLKRLHHL